MTTIEYISASTGVAAPTISSIFTALRMLLVRELTAGNEVDIPDVGKFFARDLDERDGRNPRTGEPIVIPAKRYPRFKINRTLSQEIQGGMTPIPQEQLQVTNFVSSPVLPASLLPPIPVAAQTPVMVPPPPAPPAPPVPLPPPPPPIPPAPVPVPERTWFVASADGVKQVPQSELLKSATLETQIYEPTTGWRQVKDVLELVKLLPVY